MNDSTINELRALVRDVADFPQPGIIFRDLSPVFKQAFPQLIAAMCHSVSQELWPQIDYIAGIDARGFVIAGAMAKYHDKGLVMIRKAGKLPQPVLQKAYALEYGEAVLEVQNGSGRVLLVDDVLATGNTLRTALTLTEQAGYQVLATRTCIGLPAIDEHFNNDPDHLSLIEYD